MIDSTSLNSFCFKLFSSLSAGNDENFFISPFSISTALTMTYAGARAETASQLKELLHLTNFKDEELFKLNKEYMNLLIDLNKNEGTKLNIANKIFIGKKFEILEKFEKTLIKSFKSGSEKLDFSFTTEAAKSINSFVENETENKIKNLVQPNDLTDLTKLVLINAIYFKGDWKNQFDECQTHKDDFYLNDGSSKKIEMMSLNNKKFQFKRNPANIKANTCEFLYKGNGLAMTIILPNDGVYLNEIESQLNADVLKNVLQAPVLDSSVNVLMPKFKLEFKKELASTLAKLGAPNAFDTDKADFSGLSNEDGIFISKVIHQAVVEVNEKGTEAAAATAVMMMKRCALVMDIPEEFICNRPFLFLIHEKKGNGVLFMGKFMRPE